jgi:hypothetical protein
MQLAAGGQRVRVSGAVPVAEAGESCCADCAGRACHWCVCHALDVQSAGVVEFEPLADGEPCADVPGVEVIWWVEVVLVCPEHGEQRGCVPITAVASWS